MAGALILPRRPSVLARAGRAIARLFTAPALFTGRRSYAAAQMTRLTEGWSTMSLSANADLHRSLDALRARSRQLARDNDYAKKFLQLVATNVVGSGFMLQARIYDTPSKPDTGANDAIETAFAQWAARGLCDITGRHSLRDIEQLLLKATARDGEFLVRIVRGAAARNPFGLALQLLDIDRLDTQLNRVADAGRNAIRMGVELDSYGRPVNYWLRNGHPGDLYQVGGAAATRHDVMPAADIIHGFTADRPEQVRGVPWMHASMLRMNHLAGYEESAVVAARVGASKMGFFTTPDGQAFPAATGSEGEEGSEAERLMIDADPGVMQSLPEGVGFTPFNPDYPHAMFADFVKSNLRGISSGLGVSYHSLANDLEGVNFSSIRSGTLEERDHWSVVQQWFIDAFLEPVYAEWLRNALAFGQVRLANGSPLPVEKIDKFRAHLWQPRRWEWVDPLKDINADIAAVEAGFKAPQDIAAKLGMDYEDVLVKIKAAAELRARLGVKTANEAAAEVAAMAAAAPDDTQDPPEETPAERTLARLVDVVARMDSRIAGAEQADALSQRSMANLSQALAERPLAVTVNSSAVEVRMPEMPAPVVNVERAPEQPIIVNVPAPVVNVSAPNVDAYFEATIQPAEVRLEIPPRKTLTSIVRDADKRIETVTQTETDA